jgi:hypothetical protein
MSTFLVPAGEGELWMIELKPSGTVYPAMANSMLALRRATTWKDLGSLLVYRPSAGAPTTRAVAPGAEAVNVHQLIEALRTQSSQRRLRRPRLDRTVMNAR